jgi:hypothetical protein
MRRELTLCVLTLALLPAAARAQHEHMPMPAKADTVMSMPAPIHRRRPRPMPVAPANPDSAIRARRGVTHPMPAGHGMDMPMHDHAMTGHAMPAFYGPYAFTREASGTAWQPEAAPHDAIHAMGGPWTLMLHGFAFLVADHQGGPRGDDQVFSSNMLMGLASRPLGAGRLGARAMLSLEPATIGRDGYPLLLQTGETADGVTHLIDRQHPHDLFMELAATYSVSHGTNAAFVYAGLPGEPALGPPAFMHRVSGMLDPEAPITHHWLDSSHITFGVLTLGGVTGAWKAEASAFRGREPDQERWNIESPDLDSYSGRLSWNPSRAWALQVSAGRLESPEQLAPTVDTDRFTASAIWAGRTSGHDGTAMLAWGRNRNRPGETLDAWLLEGTIGLTDRVTLLARAERAEKDELFDAGAPLAGAVFNVARDEIGVLVHVLSREHLDVGLGALGSASFVPFAIRSDYGDTPLSGSLFLRAALK